MSYANSTINTYAQQTNWYQGEQADGASGLTTGTLTTLGSGAQYQLDFTLGRGSWVITVTSTITIRDATTAWSPSIFAVYDSLGQNLGAQSLCGSATYANGTILYSTLTLWTNSNVSITNPFYVGFTPEFAGSTTAPQISVNLEYVKIR
jgi:hypothetical protein